MPMTIPEIVSAERILRRSRLRRISFMGCFRTSRAGSAIRPPWPAASRPAPVAVVRPPGGSARTPPVVREYDQGVTTGRRGGDTIAAVSTVASRWGWPLVTVALTELVTLGGSGAGAHRTGRPVDLLAVVLLVIAAGASGFARRWPAPALAASLAATSAYLGLGYPYDGTFFVGLGVTAYLSAAANSRLRAMVFGTLIVVLFSAAGWPGYPADPLAGLPFALILLGALVVGQALAESRARANARAAEAHEAEAQRRLAEERLRIARELHDVVSHSISMINVQAGVAVHVMDERPEEARAALVAIKGVSRDALRDLRSILGLLRQSDDAEPRSPVAGLAQVPALADNVRRTGVQVALDLEAENGWPLPPSIDLTAYRVIQEGLTNVVRHAPGAAATVTVRRRADALVVEVADDGRATAAAEARQGAGQGLSGMGERVRAAGGSLEAGARPEGGFAVRATLPLEAGTA
ncbi:MAG: sensor histidine kinase [Chloroflexi bacterium]|nr:MAG: sensor histidine kinase [Chloroflexota bacterium]